MIEPQAPAAGRPVRQPSAAPASTRLPCAFAAHALAPVPTVGPRCRTAYSHSMGSGGRTSVTCSGLAGGVLVADAALELRSSGVGPMLGIQPLRPPAESSHKTDPGQSTPTGSDAQALSRGDRPCLAWASL